MKIKSGKSKGKGAGSEKARPFWLLGRSYIPHTQSVYDSLGHTIAGYLTGSQQDANLHTTNYTYDNMNRRKTRELPGGQTEFYNTYDATGNLVSKTTFDGNSLTYSYDPLTDRLTGVTGNGVNNTYQYDKAGDRVVMTDLASSQPTTFLHDERDRITEKKSSFGNITYGYDNHGNLTSEESSNPGGANVGYSYDALNRPVTVTDTHRSSNTTTYSYDGVGNLSSENLANGVSVAYGYDMLNHLTSMAATMNGNAVASYNYTLGPSGNRINVAELSGRAVTFIYDDLYRLTNETITNDPATNNGMMSYVYDPVGNRQQRSSSVTPISTQNFTNQYDANDRLTANYSYDADGSTTTDPTGNTYTYDSLDRLISVSGTTNETFAYDGDGNKVSHTINGVTTNYLVDSHNLTGYAQVLDVLQSGAVNKTYTYGLNRIAEDQLISGNWTMNYYGYDGQGSVRYLMDNNGNVTDTYTYDAFGNQISKTGTTPNVFLYDGEQQDANTGFYNLRARWMNPSIGRFQNMDTDEGEVSDPLSLHKYTFTSNNPENKIDPSGNDDIFDVEAEEPITLFPAKVVNRSYFHLLSYGGELFIKHNEGYFPKAKDDGFGNLTVGWGHKVDKSTTPLLTRLHWKYIGISITDAQNLFDDDSNYYEKAVDDFTYVPTAQYEWEALVDFSFNIGRTGYANSDVQSEINTGNYGLVSGKFFQKITASNGKISIGLINRRLKEQRLFDEDKY